MSAIANALQAVLCFSAGVGAKSIYDWYMGSVTRRKG